MGRRQTVRDLEKQVFAEHHELPETARVVGRETDRLNAARGVRKGHRADPGAGAEAFLASRTVVDDLRGKFVAHDELVGAGHGLSGVGPRTRRRELLRPLQHVEVRAADSARQALHENLSRARFRVGHGVDDDFRSTEYGRTHDRGIPQPARRVERAFF